MNPGKVSPLLCLLPLSEKCHRKEQGDEADDDHQDADGERNRQSLIDGFVTGVSHVSQRTLTAGLPVGQHTSTILAYDMFTCSQMTRHATFFIQRTGGRGRHTQALESNTHKLLHKSLSRTQTHTSKSLSGNKVLDSGVRCATSYKSCTVSQIQSPGLTSQMPPYITTQPTKKLTSWIRRFY